MKNILVIILLLLPSCLPAQRSIKDINRGTFPAPRAGVVTQEDENKRKANTMDANGQYIGPVLVPVVVDGTVVFVPKDKALVVPAATQQSAPEEAYAPAPYSGGTTIVSRPYRDAPNPKIKNWPRVFLGLDAAQSVLSGSGVTVAVFDSGVNAHEQFAYGSVDVLDITEGNNNNDDFGHGTAVIGIIAGRGAQESGFIGVAPAVKVISFKIADKEGLTNNLNIAKAVDRVLDYNGRHPQNKINIINISYGLTEDDAYLKDALKKAYDNGVAIIASAGNNGNSVIAYPAAYDFVIAVAAVNHRKDFVNTSSRGPAVDFVAPGAALFVPDNMQGYGWVRGTSFSTAYITGVAALATEAFQNKYSRKPSPAELVGILAKISTPLAEISKESQGYGVPDASKILSLI